MNLIKQSEQQAREIAERVVSSILGPFACADDNKWRLKVELVLKETNLAELIRDKIRLKALSKLIWETRVVSEESDYQDTVGLAAALNSGNWNLS